MLTIPRAAALSLLLLGVSACTVDVPELEQSDVFFCRSDDDCIQGYRCFQERCVDRIINPDVLGCVDEDEDGFYTTSACGVPNDCDDTEAARFPGNEEICDGLDNDCDEDVDEGFNRLGDPCFDGLGACRNEGAFVCSEDGSEVVCDAVASEPGDEICDDGLDNDCDGETDLFDGDCITCEQGAPCSLGDCTNLDTGETLPDAVCPCNGTQECSVGGAGGVCRAEGVDNSDERRCEVASQGELECDVAGEAQSFGSAKLCDGVPDCDDGRDEEGCGGCSAGQFVCDNLTCLDAAQLCDGVQDCGAANAVAPFSRTDDDSDGIDDDCNGIIDDGLP